MLPRRHGLLLAAVFAICLSTMAIAAEKSTDPLRDAVAQVYELRGHERLWFVGGRLTPAGRSTVEELRRAEARGLDPQDYESARLAASIAALDARPFAESAAIDALDFSLSLAAAQLGADLHSGRVNPRDVGYELDVPQAKLDVGGMLTELATSANVAASLDALEPPFRHYRLLKETLAQYREVATAQGSARSAILDQQIQKIMLTLERVRWLPAKLDAPPIIVNIPQFKLFAFRTTDDFAQEILQMDVIVGAAFQERETPVFAADMRYVVLRPYWDVPVSIMRREYLKPMRANPRWVDDHGYEIVKGQTDAAAVMPATAENIELLAQGALRLRQKPGPHNALGLVKFIFPNRHNVYLHDTPAQSLFKLSRRAFSHGCIRVSEPLDLLAHVMRDDPDWTPERIEAALKTGKTMRIPLKKTIRVYIIYGTAMTTEAGPTLFFDDIYHHDARLQAALGKRSARLASLRP